MKLIDKDALVAEIRELREHEIRWMERQGFTHYRMGERDAYTRILKLLDILEVKECREEYDGFLGKELKMVDDEIERLEKLKEKEVDLEEEFDKYSFPISAQDIKDEPFTQMAQCAKHFFELGLKAQKGEKI